MAFAIPCLSCHVRHALSTELYEGTVSGRILTFDCTACGAPITLDGTLADQPDSLPEGESATELTETAFRPAEVDELDDTELASLPPSSKPSAPEGKAELTSDVVGGFLGTGLEVSFKAPPPPQDKAPPAKPKDRPPPLPKKAAPEPIVPRALSKGFLFDVDDPPPPPAEEAAAAAKVPKSPPRPPLKKHGKAVTRDLDFTDIVGDSEPPPQDPFPLTTTAPDPRPNSAPPHELSMAGLGSTDEEHIAGPPAIDLEEVPTSRAREIGGATPSEPLPAPSLDEATSGSKSLEADSTTATGAVREAQAEGARAKAGPHQVEKSGAKTEDGKPNAATDKPPSNRSKARSDPDPRPLSSPPMRGVSAAKDEKAERRSSGFLALLLIAALAGAFLWWRNKENSGGPEGAEAEAPVTEIAKPAPVLPEAPAPAVQTPETDQREEPTPDAALQESPPDQGEPKKGARPDGEAARAEPRAAPTDAEPKARGERAPEPAPTKEETQAAPSEPPQAKPAPAPSPPTSQSTDPFNKTAAVAALNGAAALASACRQPGDPSGTARVTVTFAPSGRVTSANLSGPPFAGTRTGGCIASKMRTARVPPFGGTLVTVAKSVVIH